MPKQKPISDPDQYRMIFEYYEGVPQASNGHFLFPNPSSWAVMRSDKLLYPLRKGEQATHARLMIDPFGYRLMDPELYFGFEINAMQYVPGGVGLAWQIVPMAGFIDPEFRHQQSIPELFVVQPHEFADFEQVAERVRSCLQTMVDHLIAKGVVNIGRYLVASNSSMTFKSVEEHPWLRDVADYAEMMEAHFYSDAQ